MENLGGELMGDIISAFMVVVGIMTGGFIFIKALIMTADKIAGDL